MCLTTEQVYCRCTSFPTKKTDWQILPQNTDPKWPFREMTQSSLKARKSLGSLTTCSSSSQASPEQQQVSALRVMGRATPLGLHQHPSLPISMWPTAPLGFSTKIIININPYIQHRRTMSWKEGRHHPSPGVLLCPCLASCLGASQGVSLRHGSHFCKTRVVVRMEKKKGV